MTSRRQGIAVALVTVMGLFFRLLLVGHQSYWLDEGALLRYVQTHHSVWGVVQSLAHGGDNHPPLYYLVILGMTHLGTATNEALMRLPSVLASVSIIPATWLLAGRLAPRYRLLASVLVAVSPVSIWYGQETRMYALAAAFAAWSSVAFFVGRDERGKVSGRWWAFHAVMRVLGFYTHVYAVLLSVAEALILLRDPAEVRKRGLTVLSIELACCLPWVFVLYSIRNNTAGFEHASPLVAIAYAAFVFLFGYSLGPSVRELHEHVVLTVSTSVELACAGVVVGVLMVGLWRNRSQCDIRRCTAYVGVPILLCTLISLVSSVAFNVRYILVVLPSFLCVLATSLTGLRYLSRMRIGQCVAIMFVGLTSLSLVNWWHNPRYGKDDYRSAVAYLVTHRQGSEPVLALTYTAPIEVYADNHFSVTSLAPDSNGQANWAALRRGGLSTGTKWVLVARPWELDDNGAHLAAILRVGVVSQHLHYPGVDLYKVVISQSDRPVVVT